MGASDPQFKQRRTREELNALLHYGHIIPVSKGWTRAYVNEHFPGWTWNELVRIVRVAGILVSKGGSPPRCDERVQELHFDSENAWLVEWTDGSRSSRQAK